MCERRNNKGLQSCSNLSKRSNTTGELQKREVLLLFAMITGCRTTLWSGRGSIIPQRTVPKAPQRRQDQSLHEAI